jgi:hypothetical protein
MYVNKLRQDKSKEKKGSEKRERKKAVGATVKVVF